MFALSCFPDFLITGVLPASSGEIEQVVRKNSNSKRPSFFLQKQI